MKLFALSIRGFRGIQQAETCDEPGGGLDAGEIASVIDGVIMG